MRNIDVVNMICDILDEMFPEPGKSRRALITYIKDRPGHDFRYAIDSGKLERELGWTPKESFETGLRRTVNWYLDNGDWVERIKSGNYKSWIDQHYNS